MSAKTTKQVRLHLKTVERALEIEDRTGIAEKTVYALAVEAGMPSVEQAADKIKRAASGSDQPATGDGK